MFLPEVSQGVVSGGLAKVSRRFVASQHVALQRLLPRCHRMVDAFEKVEDEPRLHEIAGLLDRRRHEDLRM